jgi:hypothetical protein
MKKVFALAVIAASFTACNNAAETTDVKIDSAVAAITDTVSAKIDSAAAKIDSTVKAATDTMAAKVDSLKK